MTGHGPTVAAATCGGICQAVRAVVRASLVPFEDLAAIGTRHNIGTDGWTHLDAQKGERNERPEVVGRVFGASGSSVLPACMWWPGRNVEHFDRRDNVKSGWLDDRFAEGKVTGQTIIE